jgi:hypothetical protein
MVNKALLLGFLSVLILTSAVYGDITHQLPPEIRTLYRTLMQSENHDAKRAAAASLREIYEETRSEDVIDVIIDLMRFTYNHNNFSEQNQRMFYDDMIAMRLIEILEISKDPRVFPTLIRVVARRNHTQRTIDAAWKAIKAIDWSKENK